MFDAATTLIWRSPHPDSVQYYTFDAVAGRRYLVTLQSLTTDFDDSRYSLDGRYSGFTVFAVGHSVAELVVEADMDGPYPLLVQALGWRGEASNYRIGVVALPEEDAGGVADEGGSASVIGLRASAMGTLDHPTDTDVYYLDLDQGQRYVVTLEGRGDHPLQGGAVGSLYDYPLGSFSVLAGTRGYGSWIFQVRSTGGVGEYVVTVAPRPDDDHADFGNHPPSSLDQQSRWDGVIEAPGDVDSFEVTDRPGARVEVRLTRQSEASGSMSLYAWSQEGFRSFDTAGPEPIVFLLPGTGTETIHLAVQGQGVDLGYRLEARALARDDHSDSIAGATPLPLEQATFGQLDSQTDRDTFSLELTAGMRYRIAIQTDRVLRMLEADVGAMRERPASELPGQSRWWVNDRLNFVQIVAADTGLYSFSLGHAEADYQLRLSVLEGDDHSDSALGATPLAEGEVGGGLLDTFDVDSFSIAAVPGRSYHVTFTPTGGQAFDSRWIGWQGPAGSTGQDEPGRDLMSRSLEFKVAQAGAVLVQLHSAGGPAWPYAVQVDAVETRPVNPPDPPQGQTGDDDPIHLSVGPLYQPNVMVGTAAADPLAGSPQDDVMQGGMGRDQFVFSAGVDKIDGGPDEDMLRVTGPRSDYILESGPWQPGWSVYRVADRSITHVENLERIAFTDVGLLLQAGSESDSVLRLLQATYGAVALYDDDLIGRALSRFDHDHDLQALARWALHSRELQPMTDSESSEILVRWVSSQVPGLLESEAQVQHWVELLDHGHMSREAALVAAVTGPAEAVYLIGLSFPVSYTVFDDGP